VACLSSNGNSAHAEVSRGARLGPDDSIDKTESRFHPGLRHSPYEFCRLLVLLDASDQLRMPKRELLSAVKSLLCLRSCRSVSREYGAIGTPQQESCSAVRGKV
jgi:hypothetical protein